MTDNLYPVGTIVFAKLKGYPWWPARIESDEDLPINVSSKKPKTRPIWPVFFFGSYDYGWFGTTELKAFDPASAEKAKSSLKKGHGLRTALSEALDPSLMNIRTAAAEQDYDDDEFDQESVPPAPKKAAAKKKTEKAKARARDVSDSEQTPAVKKRRPSTTEDQAVKRRASNKSAPVDDEDEDEDDSPKPKKRSNAVARSRLESDLRSVDDDISVAEPSNGRSRRSEEDGGDSDHGRAKKKIRSGQPNERLLKLRHKLQKLLLADGLSDEVLVQNLDRADPILAEVEAFEIDFKMLKDTKIGRLMKKISGMQFSQDQHHIVDRSLKLIKSYRSLMEKAHENGEGASPADKDASTAASTVVPPQSALSNGAKESSLATAQPTPASADPVLDAAPAPEAVVAAVAAIVETNALPLPLESSTEESEATLGTSTTTL